MLVDLRESGDAITARPIRTMINHETNQLYIDNLRVPVKNRIGEEGKGFQYILSGLNAERILIASELLGDGYWFIEQASRYACEARGLWTPHWRQPGRAVSDCPSLRAVRSGEHDAIQGHDAL